MWEALTLIKTIFGWIGWLGAGAVPLAIAAAVIWFFPPARKPAIAAGVLWLVAFTAYTLGDSNGASRVQTDWDAALDAAADDGKSDRAEAEREIPQLAPEPAPEPAAVPSAACPAPAAAPARTLDRRLLDDPYNRDRRQR